MYQRRNGRRNMILGGAIIVLVLLLGFLLLRGGIGGGGGGGGSTALAPVVVASQAIPQGTLFKAGQPLGPFFVVKQFPQNAIPFGAYTSLDQIDSLIKSSSCLPKTAAGCQGQVTTTQTIYQDLPVVSGMFTTLGSYRVAAGPAFQIPYGYVGVGISFSQVNSVLGSIQPGDDIDVIASYNGPENPGAANAHAPKQTQYVLSDMRVIGVNGPPPTSTQSSGNTQGGGTLLLLARYQQALVIQHLKDFGGSWALSAVLRSSKEADVPHFRTFPVTERWFFVKVTNHFDDSWPY